MRRRVLLAAAAAVLGAALLWRGVLAPRREDRAWLSAARAGLEALAALEQVYCFHTGRYTDDLLKLVSFAERPEEARLMAGEAFEPGSLVLEPLPDRVRLSARARDRARTPVAYEASRPPPESRPLQ